MPADNALKKKFSKTLNPLHMQMLSLLSAGFMSLPVAAAERAATGEISASPMHAIEAKMASMQAQISQLQNELDTLRRQHDALLQKNTSEVAQIKMATLPTDTHGTPGDEASAPPEQDTKALGAGIQLGGAVRFQHSYENYNRANRRRKGDQDFDIFRLDLHGKISDVALDAQWRWYPYMTAMHHAWLGYDFNERSHIQAGLTRIPFGNQPYNSHNYFFSSNYYLGLEDTHAMGLEFSHRENPWNIQAAFFKNDATGGVDGAGSRRDSYSSNIVGIRAPGEGAYDDPSRSIGLTNMAALRLTRNLFPHSELAGEFGLSTLYGGLNDSHSRIGRYRAWALHGNLNYKQLNVQLQATRYDHKTDSKADQLVVGAYGFYDSIAARANT